MFANVNGYMSKAITVTPSFAICLDICAPAHYIPMINHAFSMTFLMFHYLFKIMAVPIPPPIHKLANP